ncbi:MAG: hypothetical protein ACR2PF_14665 [Rhizobiaceae bacterium]
MAQKNLLGLRDVSDFHLHWDDFRKELLASLEQDCKLDKRSIEIVHWLVAMADRISLRDLE